MTEAAFERAVRAAGALAVAVDPSAATITFEGDAVALGLSDCAAGCDLSGFERAVAPGDRAALAVFTREGPADARLRLIGEDGEVRYVRLIGEGDGRGWRGLLAPAGASLDGGLKALDREAALLDAVESGAMRAHHQPVVRLESGGLAGFEALARWVRPDAGVLGPDDFLPMARERGLTRQVGDAVRASAAKDCSAWRAARPQAKRLFVAANATAGELCAPDFPDRLIAMVRAAGLPRGAFKLEINETEVMRDADVAEAALKQIKAAGIALALDDFGTGYSSLARLDRFPFDVVKIDQYFTRAAVNDASARAIIASVVRIARSYAMTIVAEGVETEDAAEVCRELGCDFGQGYHFASALPPAEAAHAVLHGVPGRFDAAC